MSKSIDLAIVLILFLVSFCVYSSLAHEYEKTGAFQQKDVLFDADAEPQLIQHFAHGWAATTPIHPWFRYYYHPFVRISEKVVTRLGYGNQTSEATRVAISIYCIPFTAALGVSALYIVFRLLPLSILESLAMSCTGMLSFSNLIFGSLPDRFATSGLLLTIALGLTTQALANQRNRWLLWITVGCLSMGTTITQLAPVATLFFVNRAFSTKSIGRSLIESVVLCAAVCGIVAASTTILHYSAKNQNVTERTLASHTVNFLNTPVSHKLEFVSAIPNAIAPSKFGIEPYPEVDKNCHQYKLTLENVHSPVRSILISMLFVTGAVAMVRSKTERLRILGVGAALVVIGNLLLHAFWGFEWVLFSQHWLSPSLVLLSGNLLFFRDNAKLRYVASIAVLILVATNNYFLISSVLETLRDGSLCLEQP